MIRWLVMKITLDVAEKIIDAGIKEAQRMSTLCSIAIANENEWPIAVCGMDGALIPTVDIARDKAWTAAAFKMPSSEVTRFGDPSRPDFGFNTQNWNDRLATIPGGLPIKNGSEVIGAVGVSGGTPQQDVAVSESALLESR